MTAYAMTPDRRSATSYVMISKPRSPAQTERQHDQYRDGGKYHTMNPCELCGKGVGADYFTSKHHGEGAFGGKGLILHKACCQKLDAMSEEDAMKALHVAPKPKAGAAKAAIPNPPEPTPRMKELDAEYKRLHEVVMKGTDDEVWKAKMKIVDVRSERARLWKAHHVLDAER